MKQRIANAIAMVCLALAIGAVIGSVKATLDAGRIEGPSALLVTPGGPIWLGVNDELWRITSEGKLIDRQPIAATGVHGAPANLVHGPGGSVVASVRRDPTLYVLDAARARVTRALQPQWPEALAKHGGRAINFAFDPKGRVAIATGGGDAVALFDGDGRFLAHTPRETYVFSNGLWWSDAGWWTTDTNRFTLRLLDADSMQPLRALELGHAEGGSFLGPARAHPRAGSKTQAALIRFHGNMIDGGVSLVSAEGSVTALPHDAPMQPRDLDWLGDELLVSDGVSFSILRWSAQAQAVRPFGDEALQAALGAQLQERDGLRLRHRQWLGAAGVALVLGLLCAAAASWLARRERPAAALDLSRLGTAQLSRREVLRLNWRMHGWAPVAFVLLLTLQALSRFWPLPQNPLDSVPSARGAIVGLAVAFGVVVLAAVVFYVLVRRIKRLSIRPEFEPLLNQLAMTQLKRSSAVVARDLREGEHVLEVFQLRPGLVWWVLTSERLLGFNAALGESALKTARELIDVTAATNTSASGWKHRLVQPSDARAWLAVTFAGSPALSGSVGSPVLAARVVERLNERVAALRVAGGRPPLATTAQPAQAARRRRAALSSLLLPGLGHWQLGYSAQAIVFIVVGVATLVFFTVPMLWTLVEPFTGVKPWHWWTLAGWHLLLAATAAADAWRTEPH
jgi:hypothetical protein